MPGTTSAINRLAYEVAAKDVAWPVLPVVMADTQTGEILYVSKYAADVFGYEVTDLLGKSIELLVPDALRESHSRWRKDASVPKTRLMGVGRQIRGQRKDGSTFPAHIGLTEMTVFGRRIGVAFVIDLTGVSIYEGHGPADEEHPDAGKVSAHGPDYEPTRNAEPVPPPPETMLAREDDSAVDRVFLAAKALEEASFYYRWRNSLSWCRLVAGALALVSFVTSFALFYQGCRGVVVSADQRLRAAVEAMRRKDYAAAEDLFEQAASLGADPTAALGGKAETLFYRARYDEALTVLDRLDAAAPNSGRAHLLRGLVYRRTGREPEAKAEFCTALYHGERVAVSLLRRDGPVTRAYPWGGE